MNHYAISLREGLGIDVDKKESFRYFKLSHDKGNIGEMNDSGFMFFNGFGTEVNYEKAADYFKMSADKGSTIGMRNYGYMLRYGRGIPINKKEALHYIICFCTLICDMYTIFFFSKKFNELSLI